MIIRWFCIALLLISTTVTFAGQMSSHDYTALRSKEFCTCSPFSPNFCSFKMTAAV